jgi:hypothetical protein
VAEGVHGWGVMVFVFVPAIELEDPDPLLPVLLWVELVVDGLALVVLLVPVLLGLLDGLVVLDPALLVEELTAEPG